MTEKFTIVRRSVGGGYAVMRVGSGEEAALVAFGSPEAAERYRVEHGPRYDLFEVAAVTEAEMLDTCAEHGLKFVAYSEDGMSGADIYEI
jgi:hypothetical protein